MKNIIVPKKKLIRLKRAVRDIKLDLFVYQFEISKFDEMKLYKSLVKEVTKAISIIDKMIDSRKKITE
jgi:hypothetical protein